MRLYHNDGQELHMDPERLPEASQFPRLRPSASPELDRPLLAPIVAVGAAIAAKTLLPPIVGATTTGPQDEWSALLAALSAALLTTVRDARHLCWRTQRKSEALEVGKGGAGGLAAGLGVTVQTAAPLISFLDGGILVAAIALGGLFVHTKNRANRAKECPHCGLPGSCTQRVCRHCFKIFYPASATLDCKNSKLTLSWYEVASLLQEQGLSFPDALGLLEEEGSAWGVRPQTGGFYVVCEMFKAWFESSSKKIIEAVGKAARLTDRDKLRARLDEMGM
jgi:hypothetical protein